MCREKKNVKDFSRIFVPSTQAGSRPRIVVRARYNGGGGKGSEGSSGRTVRMRGQREVSAAPLLAQEGLQHPNQEK